MIMSPITHLGTFVLFLSESRLPFRKVGNKETHKRMKEARSKKQEACEAANE